jgi:WD40 repeat protein/predicted Ser/Thr protein kinase
MPDPTPCPETPLLRRLLLGELPPPELEPLAGHVLHCDRCAETLNGLRPDDPLLQTLREADTGTALDPAALLLIERLSRGLPAAVAQGGVTTRSDLPSVAVPTACGAAAPAGVDSSVLGVLAPPGGAGELGRLGGYRVLKLLGKGGMGAVFLAEDPQLERHVALKVMLPEVAARPEARSRFLREARASARLKDDHVAAIYQVGEDRGVPFLVMEYLEGESLEGWLRRGEGVPEARLLRVARDVARGLAAAHAKGLVHRDIKPANLWLEEPQGRVKILDFGLASGDVHEVHLTQTGVIVGTPLYMAPEQGRGEPADARSDLFSLGCVLYRLCTGQAPFQRPTLTAVLTSLATDEPVPVRQRNPQIPQALADLVMRLLAKRPDDRPATARAVLQELEAIERRPTAVAPAPEEKSGQQQRRPRRRALVAAALLGVAGVLGLGGLVIRITGKDGKQTEITVPEGSKVTVNEKGEVDVKLPGAGEGPAAALAATASPLDKLDPASIPAAERFDWQPKELVAVLGEHRQRHWGFAQAVAVSPDGRRIATSGSDGLIRFWDAATCREQGSIRINTPGNFVTAVAFSPDNKRLAFWTIDAVGFCDLSGAAAVREKAVLECRGHGYYLAFTPDGKRLVGSDQFGTLSVWDVTGARAKPLLTRKGFVIPGTNCAFDLARDGRTLAFPTGERAVSLLDVTGADVRELAVVPLPAPAWRLALSADGKRLAVGFQTGKVQLWDVGGKEPASRGVLEAGIVPRALRFSPDGERLAVAYTDIRLWRVQGPKPAGGEPFGPSLGGNSYEDLTFTPDGKSLVTVNLDSTVRFWDVSGGEPRERNPLEPSSYLNPTSFGTIPLVFSKDGKRAATLKEGVRWWDLSGTSAVQGDFMPSRWTVAVAPHGKTLLLSTLWTRISWCDLTKEVPEETNQFDQPERGASVMRLFPDDRRVAVGTEHGEVRIVERTDENVLVERSRFKASEENVRLLEVSPDGRMVAVAAQGAVQLWDLTGQNPGLRGAPIQASLTWHMAFSPDSRMLAVSADNATTVWDLQERRPKERAKWERYSEEGATHAVAFSPDGRTLASATDRGRLTLRDPQTGALRKEWQLPGPIRWVRYAPDGRHLATVNGNGTGYIFRLAPPPAAGGTSK